MNRRRITAAAAITAALALTASAVSSAARSSPPLISHDTHCTHDVQGATPFDEWQGVHMLLPPGGGDGFWIDSPTSLAGHYLIQTYRYAYGDPKTLPADDLWSSWISKGKKTGPTTKSTFIECKGSFADDDPPYWVDSIDLLVPAGK